MSSVALTPPVRIVMCVVPVSSELQVALIMRQLRE